MTRKSAAAAAAAGVTVLVGAGVLTGSVASARPEPIHVGVTSTRVCGGVLEVYYNTEVLQGREWMIRLDDGATALQLRDVAGRWRPVASKSGGEGARRFPWAGGYDAARIVHTPDGITSTGVPIDGRCSA
jgi:hypothetical protein